MLCFTLVQAATSTLKTIAIQLIAVVCNVNRETFYCFLEVKNMLCNLHLSVCNDHPCQQPDVSVVTGEELMGKQSFQPVF